MLSVVTPIIASNPASGTWQFSFDTASRPAGELGPDGKRVQFGWDVASNRTGLTFPDGVAATASYSSLKQLIQVQFTGTDAYDGLGLLHARVPGNGYTHYRLYNGPGRLDLTDVQTFLANGFTNTGIFYHHTYNGAHQVASTNRQGWWQKGRWRTLSY